jgi:uncharacterized protein
LAGGVNNEDGAIYVGIVAHKRARPKRHSLRYNVFSMLVDLDQLESIDKTLRLFSLERFNIFSLFARDFGPRDGTSLAEFIRRRAASAGIGAIARVRMLAYPRMFGFAFNPLTLYFCEDEADETVFLVYEVRNTFGEHHFYQARVDAAPDGSIAHDAKKAFYVSPFNTLDGTYRFSVRPPGERVFMGITLSDLDGGLVTAYFSGQRQPLTDFTLAKLMLAYPFMTAKVMLGIHWEALLLWLKGVKPTLGLRRERRDHGAVPR